MTWFEQLNVSKKTANVLSLDGKADEFEILAGFLQGVTLAQYLFTIAIDIM